MAEHFRSFHLLAGHVFRDHVSMRFVVRMCDRVARSFRFNGQHIEQPLVVGPGWCRYTSSNSY